MIQMDNEQSYISVVEEFSNLVYRIAYQNLMNVADSEDVVQEVFIKLLRHGESFVDKEHLKAWLLRVTINQCRDFRKMAFRKKESSYESLEQFDQSSQEAEENFVLSELQKLPEIDRNIVYLHYYEGYSLCEIAGVLGKSPNAVNVRLVRARKKLKTILSEEGLE
ncbi:MAG: RNA polymerase sigma factor [Lachnospiraceae bacterium]|nr:RNA polymerase sigma factor [Lachnospiraceae bacterium]